MESRRKSRWRRRTIAWLIWFAALNLLWLLLISSFVPEEEILGLFASAIAATAAVAVAEQRVVAFRPRLRWLLEVRRLPWQSGRETGEILAALWRALFRRSEVHGRFRIRRVTLPSDPAESQAMRALLIAGESFPPNTYVLGIDEESGLMLVHELIERDDG